MAQWGKAANSAHSVKWAAASINAGSGNAARASNNTALYNNTSVGAFTTHNQKVVIGQFAVSTTNLNVSTGECPKVRAPGYQLRRAWMGPVVSLAVSNTGSGFANGETVLLSGGSVNCVARLTSNSGGSLTSAAVSSNSGGVFANASSVAFSFRREQHVANITVTGNCAGFQNTDYLVGTNSNGQIAFVAANATIQTNSQGGFTNGTITLTNVGLFSNTAANSDVTVTAFAANGSASAGTGATLLVKLTTSTNGGLTPTMGGRAGRVHYECLVESSSVANSDATSRLPNT